MRLTYRPRGADASLCDRCDPAEADLTPDTPSPTATPRASIARAKGGAGWWSLTAPAAAALVGLPLVWVLASLARPDADVLAHLAQTVLPDYTGQTLALMALTGVLATGIGVSTAWLTAATEFPGRRLLSWALVLPLAAPAYVTAYVYAELLDVGGPVATALGASWMPPVRSLPGAALVLAYVLYPYVYLLTRAAFAARSATVFEAARSLGAGPWSAFRRVALPAARPAIIGGLALVLMETLADYGVAQHFGVPTFSVGIFRTWYAQGSPVGALNLAAVALIVVAVLVWIERASRKGQASALARDAGRARMRLSGGHAVWALFGCLTPVVLGFLIPAGRLVQLTLIDGDALDAAAFLELARNSVTVAAIAAVIAVALAAPLAYARRLKRGRVLGAATGLATLGYALPGAVLAIGLLAPLTLADRALVGALRDAFGYGGGLILTGSVAALIYAYVVRFLTVSYNAADAGLSSIPSAYDEAARTLGAGPGAVARRVHWPLLRGPLLAGGLLVFVDALRELPATLVLRPFDFDTLATRVFRLASDERLAEASTAALALIVAGLIPVIALTRLSDRR